MATNDMNYNYRNERFPDNPALRQTMAGNQDTRMAIMGGMRKILEET